MQRKHIIGLTILLLIFAVTALVAAFRTTAPVPQVKRGPLDIEPLTLSSKANPGYAGWVAYATIHNSPGTPPARPTQDAQYPGNYPLGMECQEYLDAVWATQPTGGGACTSEPCSTSNIDWTLYTNCVNAAAGRTVKYGDGSTGGQPVVLTIPGRWLEEGGSGTSGAPYIVNKAPSWMKTLSFTQNFERTTGVWYTGSNVDNTSFLNRMRQMVTEAGAQFDDDANVVAVRINTGLVGETQLVKCMSGYNDTGCTSDKTLRTTHESAVASCTSYLAFIDSLARAAAAAFPHKPIYIEAGPAACGGVNPNDNYETRQYLWENATQGWVTGASPVAVGYSYNAIAPDHANADGNGATWDNYLFFRFAKTGAAYSTPIPVVPEYQRNSSTADTFGDAFAYNVWTAYAAAGIGADGIMPFVSWASNYSDLYWRTVDTKFGNQPTRAWIVFREREHPTYLMDAVNTVNYGGFREDYQANLAILTPTAYPQYCNSNVISVAATEIAARTNPTPVYKPCGNAANVLPTPKATVQTTPSPDATSQFNILQRVGNRQARQIAAGGALGLAANNAWVKYGGTSDVALTLTYLDIGTDDIIVKTAKPAGATDNHTVDKVNSGLWKTETWTVSGALISNALAVASRGNAFVEIDAGATNAVYLHTFDVQVTSAATATPTATNTPTNTATPTATFTATSTRTPTPTSTPVYPVGVRFNEVNSNEGADWNLSGDVNEADRWFELVNWQTGDADLSGWSVSNGTSSYTFADGANIAPRGYKVLLAENVLSIPDSGTLTLRNAQATPVATVVYSQATPNLCYATNPNASTNWTNNRTCTPGQPNE